MNPGPAFCAVCQEAEGYCVCPSAPAASGQPPRQRARKIPNEPPPIVYDPGPVPVGDLDGAALLDETHEFLCAYVAFPTVHAPVAVTLWAAHTHLAAGFESTPRLALLSPEKQCGKSRVLELLALLAAGAETLSDASPAYLFRRIGAGPVTILLDEADAIWKPGRKADETAEALRSIVNAGHRRSATVGRVEMNGTAAKLVRFPVYAPAAIAGLGTLPDTILDRAVVVRMRRRAAGEAVREYRERSTRPEGEALRDQLAKWALDVADRVGDPWPVMPAGVADRPADVWEPLLMVADLAGGRWPSLAREACTAFVTGARDDAASEGTRLLSDLREVFGDADALFTQTILDRLHAIGEAPWADWSYGKPFSARDLADLLKQHNVRSRQLRIGEDSRKGYRRADLADSWARYLPRSAETSETSETPLASNVSDVSAVSAPGAADLPASTGATSATPLASPVADVALVADTGPACGVCGEPMTVIEDGQTTHPMCEPSAQCPHGKPYNPYAGGSIKSTGIAQCECCGATWNGIMRPDTLCRTCRAGEDGGGRPHPSR